MDSADPISLPVGHLDQVVAIGPDIVVHGGNEFTPFGILSYTNRRAFSIQPPQNIRSTLRVPLWAFVRATLARWPR
jgi:hypothetical protein